MSIPSVVMDLDGTLTVGNRVIDMFHVRPNAAKVVQLWKAKDYQVIFLTARYKFLREMTWDWLEDNEFFYGLPSPLYMSQEILLHDQAIEHYKFDKLIGLKSQGCNFLYAYGDSTTDFNAYNRVGIPVEHTFAMLRKEDREQIAPFCQKGKYAACLDGFTDEHLLWIKSQPDVVKEVLECKSEENKTSEE